jgi:hypothetical protein
MFLQHKTEHKRPFLSYKEEKYKNTLANFLRGAIVKTT